MIVMVAQEYDLLQMEYWEMNTEQKLEAAEAGRLKGNEYFKAKQYAEAADVYHRAVSFMETLRSSAETWDETETMRKADILRVPLHLNLAACKLRTKDAGAAVLSCNSVCKVKVSNIHAMSGQRKIEL